MRDWQEKELYEVEYHIAEGIPSYFVKNQCTGCL